MPTTIASPRSPRSDSMRYSWSGSAPTAGTSPGIWRFGIGIRWLIRWSTLPGDCPEHHRAAALHSNGRADSSGEAELRHRACCATRSDQGENSVNTLTAIWRRFLSRRVRTPINFDGPRSHSQVSPRMAAGCTQVRTLPGSSKEVSSSPNQAAQDNMKITKTVRSFTEKFAEGQRWGGRTRSSVSRSPQQRDPDHMKHPSEVRRL